MFEFSPVAPDTDLITILRELDHETIVDFAYEVAYDVKDFAKDNPQCSSAITECLDALKAWLDNPEAREGLIARLRASAHDARAAAYAAYYAIDASYAAAYAAYAAYYATDAVYAADAVDRANYTAANAARAAARAAYSVDLDKREAVRQTYKNKYKQWAYDYSAEVTLTHTKPKEIYATLLDMVEHPSPWQTHVILEFLYDHRMEIGNDVLSFFGVKSFGDMEKMRDEIHRSPRKLQRFYQIVRSLAERESN